MHKKEFVISAANQEPYKPLAVAYVFFGPNRIAAYGPSVASHYVHRLVTTIITLDVSHCHWSFIVILVPKCRSYGFLLKPSLFYRNPAVLEHL
jgi:hypothetical protein